MTRRKTIVILAAVVVLGIVLVALALASTGRPAAEPSPRATATPAVSAETQQEVEGYARAFVERYYNYRRPDDPAYLESFKPYVAPELYQQLVAGNRKASKFPNVPALSSSIQAVRVNIVDSNTLAVTATIEATQSNRAPQKQGVIMTWKQSEQHWQITELSMKEGSGG